MALDPNLQSFLNSLRLPDLFGSNGKDIDPSKVKRDKDWKDVVDKLRANFFRATRSWESDAPELAQIDNLLVDGAEGPLKARLYTPLAAGIGQQPAILFFHGGGFVVGDLDSHEMICVRLAHAARCRVISIDYRLAPEHKFPCAHEDALAVYDWVMRRAPDLMIDPERVAVAGDSAGGNLAAYLAQELPRRESIPPALQVLFYPLLQFVDIKSRGLTFQEGFFISPGLFDFFRSSYLGKDADPMDPRISPLFCSASDLAGIAPAHIVLCGWDPLNAEGKAYADKLAAGGVPVTLTEHPGMVHGFMNLTAISVPARDAITEAGRKIGETLGSL